jgi:hypothetical protein
LRDCSLFSDLAASSSFWEVSFFEISDYGLTDDFSDFGFSLSFFNDACFCEDLIDL